MPKYTKRTLNKGKGVHRQYGRGELVTIHNWRVHYRCNVAVCSCLCIGECPKFKVVSTSAKERVLCHSINYRGGRARGVKSELERHSIYPLLCGYSVCARARVC